MANVPRSHDGSIELIAATLVKRLHVKGHTLAAGEWAVHDAIRAGRLNTGLVVFENPGWAHPVGERGNRQWVWTELGKGTRYIPKEGPTPFNCFQVAATDALWDFWRSSADEPTKQSRPAAPLAKPPDATVIEPGNEYATDPPSGFRGGAELADAPEHLPAEAADRADHCNGAAELIREEVTARTPKDEFPNASGPEAGKSWKDYVDEQHDALELAAPAGWKGPIPHDLPVVAAGVGRFLRRELADLLDLRRDDSSDASFIQQANTLLRNAYRLLDNLRVTGAPPQPGEQRDADEIERHIRNLTYWADPMDEQARANETEETRSQRIEDFTKSLCEMVGLLDDFFRALTASDFDAAAPIYLSLFDGADGALVRASRKFGPLMFWLRARSNGATAFGLNSTNFHELTLSFATRLQVSLETGKQAVSPADFQTVCGGMVTPMRRDSDGNLDYGPILALLHNNGRVLRPFAEGLRGASENMPWLESQLKIESSQFIEEAQKSESLAPPSSDDLYPATPAGHLAFVEWVYLEVREQANALREGKYSHESIAKQLKNGVRWSEAARRLNLLAETLGTEAVEPVARVLRWELTVGAVEQIADLLGPVLRNLRDAWENRNLDQTSAEPKPTDATIQEDDGGAKTIITSGIDDPTAYVPAIEIIAKYSEKIPGLNHKRILKILAENREIKSYKPSSQRLNVHLADFDSFVKRQQSPSDPFEQLDEYGDGIKARTDAIRKGKSQRGEIRPREK
ncbi:MAG TPA: hypothetical protein VGJ26_21765 [Pirellulales bacterium]